jgi:phage terminase large subunit-like protein
MGRPAKSLSEQIQTGGFRARRPSHREQLLGPPVPWPAFAALQNQYAAARSEPERRAVALEFERLIGIVQAETRRRLGGGPALAAELAGLGKPGSIQQLLGFFPHFLAHPRGSLIGQPFQLEPWQQRFLQEFYRRDRQGRRVYRLGVLGVPRGNGKTPLAAALGLYELVTRLDGPEVYFAAGSKEQAGIGLGFARDFVEQGGLADHVQLGSTLRCADSPGTMRVLSSEGRLGHGRMPAAALIDELWAFETTREEQTYTALASALHKRQDSFLLTISTAGYNKQSLLGRIYEAAVHWPTVTTSKDGCLTIAKDEEHGQLLYWYAAPDHADLEDERIWRAVNPAGWLDLRELRRQLHDPGLGELEFRRLNLNQWTATRDAWLPTGCWQSLRSDQQIPDGAPIYVGVDIALYHDTTAVCWAHLLEDGRILLKSRVWAANPNATAHEHIPGGTINLASIEQFIRELARRYQLREVAYDPHYFQRSAELLEADGLTMVEFLQASGPMAHAYQGFYQLAREGRLAHDGDPVLAAHIEATAARKTERGWKLSKLKSSQHIDGTIACVLAVARAQHHRPAKSPQIFWIEN